MTIVTCNTIDTEHLKAVKEEMMLTGAPTIRAIWDGEIYWAVEGTHRLMAAHQLGIEPTVEHIEYSEDEMITIQWDGEDTEFVVSEIADRLFSNHDNHVLNF